MMSWYRGPNLGTNAAVAYWLGIIELEVKV